MVVEKGKEGVCGKKEKAGRQVGRPGMFEHSREKGPSGVQSEELPPQHLEWWADRNKWKIKKHTD